MRHSLTHVSRVLQDIGTWQSVFTFITYASIVTNAALIAFTTTTEDGVESSEFWLFYILQVGPREIEAA